MKAAPLFPAIVIATTLIGTSAQGISEIVLKQTIEPGVTKTYGAGNAKVVALRGIELDVYRGELLMLVGPSGCGKTTLISVIAGILDQDEGSCLVFDHDWKQMSLNAKTRYRGHHIGFVFQAFNLLPTLTAAENVAVPMLINGGGRREAIRRAQEVLAQVGLGERAEAAPSSPRELVRGRRRRPRARRPRPAKAARRRCRRPSLPGPEGTPPGSDSGPPRSRPARRREDRPRRR